MNANLTQRDVERLRETDPIRLWAEINEGKFAQPKIVRGQNRWSVGDVIQSRKPYLVIETRKGKIT